MWLLGRKKRNGRIENNAATSSSAVITKKIKIAKYLNLSLIGRYKKSIFEYLWFSFDFSLSMVS